MNALIVGFGSIGKRHFKNCQSLGFNVEIFSKHLKKMKPNRKQYNLILICSKTSDHLRDIKKIRNLSQNFFIEKPLASSVSDAEKIKKVLKGKKVMIGYTLIFHPLIKEVKEIINKKILGNIFLAQIHAGYFLPFWRKTDYRKSYSASKKEGGGVALDLIHEINYTQYLFPDSIEKIIGFKGKVSDLKISSDDIAFFGLKQKNKYLNISLNYLNQTIKRSIRLFGSKGELFCDLIDNSIIITNNKEKNILDKKIKLDFNSLYIEELKFFAKYIKNNFPLPISFSLTQGIKDLKIISHAFK
jgi:predicted dehydrogenase